MFNLIELKNIKEINAALALSETHVVVIDCYTSWCGPCKILTPKLDKLQLKYDKINAKVQCYKLNLEENDEIKKWADENKVESVPTIFIYKKETDVTIVEGANIDKIEKAINEKLNTNK
jgi:thioredoxin 1